MVILILAIMLQLADIDKTFKYDCDYNKCKEELEELLPSASSPKEKSEILWRLSRVELMLGEEAKETELKRKHFNAGITWAEMGIKEDPNNVECYAWHCANVGRECQTHSLIDQAAAVPVMTEDLTIILDKLGETNCSQAWQALSEMYYHHPFKSDKSAVNFARKAATCIPSDELRLSTYIHLADLLKERGWSKERRESEAASNKKRFNKANQSAIDKYSYFDGSDEILPWCGKTAAQISDKEEADSLIKYAKEKFAQTENPTPIDIKDHNKIQER